MLRQRDLDNMLDQIENLARSGARDQAQQMLQELQRMMNNLQAGRQQRQQQQGGPMRQQMDKLGELMRQQQQLMDETMRADSDRQSQSGEGRDRQEQGQNQPGQGQDQGQAGSGQSIARGDAWRARPQPAAAAGCIGAIAARSGRHGHQPVGRLWRSRRSHGRRRRQPAAGWQTGQALGDQGRALQACGRAPRT
jgi:hypothetical protein